MSLELKADINFTFSSLPSITATNTLLYEGNIECVLRPLVYGLKS